MQQGMIPALLPYALGRCLVEAPTATFFLLSPSSANGFSEVNKMGDLLSWIKLASLHTCHEHTRHLQAEIFDSSLKEVSSLLQLFEIQYQLRATWRRPELLHARFVQRAAAVILHVKTNQSCAHLRFLTKDHWLLMRV